jgi:plasmid maintenance system antidote protein VapI
MRLLRAKMIEKGFNVATLAKALGIHTATLYRKINHPEKFSIEMVQNIKAILGLTDEEASIIFLT